MTSYLRCPSCGNDVKSMPSHGPVESDGHYWYDGETGTCEHCSTPLSVTCDEDDDEGFVARLEEVDE